MKVMTNLFSLLKSRDITFPTKVHLVKALVFPVVVYGYEQDCEESWAPKNWCFCSAVLEKTLESPLDCKDIQPVHSKGDWCWSWNSSTLATWCEVLTHWKRLWSWEKLRAGGEGDDRGWDGWMASPTQWTWIWAYSGVGDGQGGLPCCGSCGCKELDMKSHWTELNWTELYCFTMLCLFLVHSDVYQPCCCCCC